MTNKKLILIKVEPGQNNNKFYQMEELGNGEFRANWGRVGTEGQNKTYPMRDWPSKYREKEGKGYKDISGIASTTNTQKHKAIDNIEIQGFLDTLMTYSKRVISEQYLLGTNSITQKQLDNATTILTALQNMVIVGTKIGSFNDQLVELYRTIPRKMAHVNDHIFKSKHDAFTDGKGHLSFAGKMVQDELDLLATLKTQVRSDIVTDVDKTILDILGISLIECTPDEVKIVKSQMGADKGLFKKAFRVVNTSTNVKYENFRTEMVLGNHSEGLYWHGSRNENWLSIMETGLKVKPAGVVHTGSMFGNGIYFAPLFKKSLGYTSLSGSHWTRGTSKQAYLSLFQVNLGKQLDVHAHEHWCSRFDHNECKKRKVDSMYAHAGRSLYNDELIVYHDGQCDIKYIVEVTQ